LKIGDATIDTDMIIVSGSEKSFFYASDESGSTFLSLHTWNTIFKINDTYEPQHINKTGLSFD
jgi:hypothetical protein